MHHDVLLTNEAAGDLEAIHAHIAQSDSETSADRVLDLLLDIVATLEQFPERGSHPRELLALGHHEYRQIVHKPWRVFYRIAGKRVYMVLIADGRRDMRTLLADRLLRA
ncbi:MAG: type II toxin-antitoxin system RelE/ParE family toxin [Rhodanobacteraceae bacterium]